LHLMTECSWQGTWREPLLTFQGSGTVTSIRGHSEKY
jgi:hypothetical protein